MSYYSEWKCGAMSDEEYDNYRRMENNRERYYDKKAFYEECWDYGDEDDDGYLDVEDYFF